MENLKIFDNKEFGKIRILTIDDEPWFVGKDVADVLGYSNSRKAITDHIDSEDVNTVTIRYGNKGNPNQTIINESGLYSLILSRKLPTAKKFKRWVTNEILPSIRKHGAYMTTEKIQETFLNPDVMIGILTNLKVEMEKRKELEEEVEKNKSKVLFAEAINTSEDCVLIGDFAKMLNNKGVRIGQNRLFHWMRENEYIIKRPGSSQNHPTQKAVERGLLAVTETIFTLPDGTVRTNITPKITGKGQEFFVNKILADYSILN